ncbi:hypothetical protein QOT17_008678 [Balamuthia mandrillaris]
MRRISVGLFGLPVRYPLPSEREEFKEDDSNMSDKDQCVELPPPPDTARKIAEGIRDALQRNQQVPHGPSSSLPESVIYLNTGDAKPVFRNSPSGSDTASLRYPHSTASGILPSFQSPKRMNTENGRKSGSVLTLAALTLSSLTTSTRSRTPKSSSNEL